MKPYELAEITKKAIAKRNKEKPAAIIAEIRTKMENDAESGKDHCDYCFADAPEVVEQVISQFREEGFSIKENEGPKKNITRFSWAKSTNTKCTFDKCWVGRCNQPADASGYCDEHKVLTCGCGRQATHDCEATMGAFVCGRLLCNHCRCNH